MCLQPQSFNDDALIIIDRNPTNNEGPAEPPLVGVFYNIYNNVTLRKPTLALLWK